MTGMIIEFQRHHDLKRAGAYRSQPVPRQPAAEDRLGEQIFRIADLLEELEELTFGARELPPGLLAQARATIDRSGMILERCTRLAGSSEGEEDGEHDPQPDVEDELLERMYRALDDLPAVGAAMSISETLDGEGTIVAMAADSAER
jgi:hypothetical protein